MKTRKQRIEALAHQKWVQAGKPISRDKEFWLSAESEVDAEIAREDMQRVRAFNKHVDKVTETYAAVNEILKE